MTDCRASQTRTASVARCSWAVSHTPAFHRLPISRIEGSATSRIVSSTPMVSAPSVSVSRNFTGSSRMAAARNRSNNSVRG